MANKVIADQLAITEETVKSHVTNILSKLGANDRTHAVTIALKRGISNYLIPEREARSNYHVFWACCGASYPT